MTMILASPIFLSRLLGFEEITSSRVRSTSFGTRDFMNFWRAERSGRNIPSTDAPNLPFCATAENVADAPGSSAAIPMGVIEDVHLAAALVRLVDHDEVELAEPETKELLDKSPSLIAL